MSAAEVARRLVLRALADGRVDPSDLPPVADELARLALRSLPRTLAVGGVALDLAALGETLVRPLVASAMEALVDLLTPDGVELHAEEGAEIHGEVVP